MQEYNDGIKWGELDAAAGKKCIYRVRPEHSYYQMGYYDGYVSKQNRYIRKVMQLSNRELPFFLRDERAVLTHGGYGVRLKSVSARRARLYIAAAKMELIRRGIEFEAGPEPNERLDVLMRLFPDIT